MNKIWYVAIIDSDIVFGISNYPNFEFEDESLAQQKYNELKNNLGDDSVVVIIGIDSETKKVFYLKSSSKAVAEMITEIKELGI